MRDFNLQTYNNLLRLFREKEYKFYTLFDFIEKKPVDKVIVLRHDVDLKPENSLATAKIENDLDIKGTYYFRAVPESFDKSIILKIADMGHEIGYHYETVDEVIKSGNIRMSVNGVSDEQISRAYERFCDNLQKFRKIYPVKTVCMHGSPKGMYDNRLIWKKYDYKKLGIIAEPYFDIDWNETAYFTDTGRRWNGKKTSLRDKVNSKFKYDFKTTSDIIKNVDYLPGKIMFNIHPQRWSSSFIPWVQELIWQNVKNVVKYFVVRK